MRMTDQDRYLFDLRGYVTIPDALSAEQLTTLNSLLDEHVAQEMAHDAPTHRFGSPLS